MKRDKNFFLLAGALLYLVASMLILLLELPYAIINLPKRRVEVHLDPLPDERTYGSVNNYGATETFASPFAGEVVVAELLPGE